MSDASLRDDSKMGGRMEPDKRVLNKLVELMQREGREYIRV
jgi:hypothetical protein